MDNVLKFPTDNVSLPQAIGIVKAHLYDEDVSFKSRVLAVKKVANMETHNSVTKEELVRALRWMFENYEF